MPSRQLRQSEIDLARQVFRDQVPYDRVHIASYFLPGNTVPVTMASASSLIPFLSGSRHYTIYFGQDVYDNGADQPGITREHFIHEMTHVWQGHHGRFGWEYMAESMIAQGHAIITKGDRNEAYKFEPGKPWGSYNVEQQAFLVQNWFSDGMKTDADDKLYPYIEKNIRAGRN
jgi:hypothetical protein